MPDHDILQKIGYALRVRSKHGRLVHNADALQIFFRIKAVGVLSLKILEEVIAAGSEPVTYPARMLRLLHILDDDRRSIFLTVREMWP
jgi:hypothetical protein